MSLNDDLFVMFFNNADFKEVTICEWWHMPVILALKRLRRVDHHKFKDILGYRMFQTNLGYIKRPSFKK